MIRLTVTMADDGTVYIPAPCRGCVAEAQAVYQTNAVEPNDTVTISHGANTVNLITAVNTAGLDVETGVPDDTYKGSVFDPSSTTATDTVIKAVSAGAAGIAILTILFDDSAYVEQEASEA